MELAEISLLTKVHVLLVSLLRGDPDLILDNCSIRTKHDSHFNVPDPTNRSARATALDADVVGVWTERGGPPVVEPSASAGFGSKLIRRSMAHQLGGSIAFDWSAEGLIVSYRCGGIACRPERPLAGAGCSNDWDQQEAATGKRECGKPLIAIIPPPCFEPNTSGSYQNPG